MIVTAYYVHLQMIWRSVKESTKLRGVVLGVVLGRMLDHVVSHVVPCQARHARAVRHKTPLRNFYKA